MRVVLISIMRVLFFLALSAVGLTACAHPRPIPGPGAGVPPQTTAESCAAIREYFALHGHTSVAPADMSAGCHLRIVAEEWRRGWLRRYLAERGWQRDTTG